MPECVSLPDCRSVFAVAGAISVDVVSLAARYSGAAGPRIWSAAGAQCNGRRECIAAGDQSIQRSHAAAGSSFLACNCELRLWTLFGNDPLRSGSVMITGLDLLFLEVNSLEESLAFYEGVLGMEVESVNNDSEPPMAKVRGGELRITLAQHLETMLRRGRGVHFFAGVEDVDKFYDELIARGVDVEPPVDEGWGGRFVTLEDPDKYRFFFVTWKG